MKMAKLYLFFVLLCQSFFIHAQTAGSFQEIPGSPIATGGINPLIIAFSPLVGDNLFAAVTNSSSNNVSAFRVDTNTGTFTPVPGSPFSTEIGPQGIAFSPLIDGKLFAAVTNSSSNTVSLYRVATDSGIFTPVGSFPTQLIPIRVAFSPIVNGNLFVAVTNSGSNTVSVYRVHPNNEILTSVGSFPTQMRPVGIAFSPLINDNLFLAVTNSFSNSGSAYQVNLDSGVLTPVPGSPFGTSASTPSAIAYSPLVNGRLFAGVTNQSSGAIVAYHIHPNTGTFDIVGITGTGTGEIAYSPFIGGFLFAATTEGLDDSVLVLTIDTETGAMTPLARFATGTRPLGVAYSPLVNGNLFAAVANVLSNNISIYKVVLPPIVTSINPSQGPSTGGTVINIIGKNFTGATAVFFGAIPAISFMVINDTRIIAISPPGLGIVDITVTTPVGTSAISPEDQFTYIGGVGTPLPPRDLKGKGCKKIQITRHGFSFVNILTWKEPVGGPPIVAYQIYRDKSLTRLIGEVPSDGNLRFKDRVRGFHKTYTYFVVSVDALGDVSAPSKVKVTEFCEKQVRNKLFIKISKILRGHLVRRGSSSSSSSSSSE